MASSILFIAVLFFSIRGFFLGFTGVIARLLGLILGYFIAFSYRYPLAELISQRTSIDVPIMLIQIAAGAGLFFGTMFITSLFVKGFFAILAKLIPLSKDLLDKQSPGSRVFGAGCNGLIGAAIVLIALWGYDLMTDSPEPPDTLQQVANRFGDSMLALAGQWVDDGSAKSNSKPDTDNSFSIGKLLQQSTDTNTPAIDIKQLLGNEQIQSLLNDPAIREMALKQLGDNPEQMQEALKDPKFNEILQQLESQ